MGKKSENREKKRKLKNFKQYLNSNLCQFQTYYLLESLVKMSQDAALQRLIAQTQAQQQVQAILHDLTEKCWDTCIDKPGPKMDGKSENCLKNCVQRFLDTNIAVTQNLEKKATNILQNHDNLGMQ